MNDDSVGTTVGRGQTGVGQNEQVAVDHEARSLIHHGRHLVLMVGINLPGQLCEP